MSAAWPSFTEAWYSPSAATIFARRSRNFGHRLQRAKLKRHGMLRDHAAPWRRKPRPSDRKELNHHLPRTIYDHSAGSYRYVE
jgi:hypothetical protein